MNVSAACCMDLFGLIGLRKIRTMLARPKEGFFFVSNQRILLFLL